MLFFKFSAQNFLNVSGILRKKRNKSFEIFLSVWWNFSKLAWRSLSVKILSNERKYHDVLCVVWTTNLTIITAVIKVINLSNASWSSTSKVLSLSKLAHYGAKNILNAHLNFETHTIWGNMYLLKARPCPFIQILSRFILILSLFYPGI